MRDEANLRTPEVGRAAFNTSNANFSLREVLCETEEENIERCSSVPEQAAALDEICEFITNQGVFEVTNLHSNLY